MEAGKGDVVSTYKRKLGRLTASQVEMFSDFLDRFPEHKATLYDLERCVGQDATRPQEVINVILPLYPRVTSAAAD